jgi:hypothetical protein
MSHKKRFGEVANRPGRRWRHRNEMQEDIRTKHDKNQSEKETSNYGSDFHPRMVA